MKLNASALKWLALCCMVTDHVAYFFGLPVQLRWVGRLAAPIFLFFVVEGFCHTRSLKKYLLRMYAVAVTMGFINAVLAAAGGSWREDHITPTNSICSTFFLLLVMLQGVRMLEQQHPVGLLLLAAPFAVHYGATALLNEVNAKLLLTTVLPSPICSEGGVSFLAMGILLYLLQGDRRWQLGGFAAVTVGIFILPYLAAGATLGWLFFAGYQWMQIFAVVPLALYSGEKGESPRWFFYLFYPAHIYLLYFISVAAV